MKKTSLFLLFLLLVLFTNAQSDERGYIVKVGDMAPDIEIRYLDGTVKKLSDFKGKVVMLQFTASWCGVCRKEMPYIEKDIWQKHKNNSAFALIGIDLKESAEKTAKFAKNWRLIIAGTKGFDFAQITSGGIPIHEIEEFESKCMDNLYICGELLDRQFPCGGYNLDFAWHSGIKTADRIVKKRNDKNT